MSEAKIIIKGARQHNLKNIDLVLPRDKFVVITGLSGSGKSSLAFDTIYAEGQRRYIESLSAYARQFLGQMDKPDVDYIEGLSPAISIDQKTTSRNPRSTVGTVTEIYDYLRLLYARAGEAFCPSCGKPIRQQTIEQMTDSVLALGTGQKIMVMAPVVDGRKGTHQKLLERLVKDGYVRVRVDGEIYLLSDDIHLDKNKKHTIEVVVDRLVVKKEIETRLTDSLETAAALSDGIVHVLKVDTGEVLTFSQNFACPDCHVSLPEIEPRLFSFNSPFGACPACSGIGSTMEVDRKLVLPDEHKPFLDGAVAALSNNPNSWFMRQLGGLLAGHGYSLENTFADLDEYYLKTIHHEFVHIVNQTKDYPREFGKVTPTGYVNDSWSSEKYVKGYEKRGFVTAYSQKEEREDFAEVVSTYIISTDAQWKALLKRATVVDANGAAVEDQPGVTAIEKKLEIAKRYYKETFNVDLEKVREAISSFFSIAVTPG